MCGIAGIVSKGKIDERVIGAMVDALSHRGPDARGAILSEDETIFLGHTRLSIIDLDARANQPFFSRDGRYVIVFNGEIYNYQQIARQLKAQTGINFRSTSDTEVIVEGFAHWGIAVLDRMEGMFALAIADLKTSNVYFFRDRIGKKPLYYFCSPELFVFASELKSLLQHPAVRQQKKVNKGVINQFLHLGYIPEPNTIFENIYKFPAGHWGELNRLLQLELKPYWKVGAFGGFDREKNSNRALEELQRRLDDAVKNRLVSDVPLGAFLSGGTDSSL
ncbi:MAG: asparagine synthetase B family protein, partial [Bacteroidota bacterium]